LACTGASDNASEAVGGLAKTLSSSDNNANPVTANRELIHRVMRCQRVVAGLVQRSSVIAAFIDDGSVGVEKRGVKIFGVPHCCSSDGKKFLRPRKFPVAEVQHCSCLRVGMECFRASDLLTARQNGTSVGN